MGKKIVLTGVTLTDTTAPKLALIDPIESSGSLFLVDWSHPSAAYDTETLPENNQGVPNLLASIADSLVGESTAGIFGITAGYNGTKGLLEWSTKKGLHGVASPTLADNTVNCRVLLGEATEQYIIDNQGHTFYFSVWGYITKEAGGTYPGLRMVASASASPSNNYLAILSNTVGTRRQSTVGAAMFSTTGTEWSGGSAPASAAAAQIKVAALPVESLWNATTTAQRAQGGFIHYRSYVEDLTVSGRTYEEVDAIDHALYTAAVLTPGGRYYGDTFTDPATIP